MENLKALFDWPNIIYTLPFGVAILLLTLSAIGVLHDSDAGGFHAEAEVAAHAEADFHAHDVDAHADHDVHADHDHDVHGTNHGNGASFLQDMLSFIGLGRVPLFVLLQTFLLWWGIIGLTANQALTPILREPNVILLVSLAITSVSSLVLMAGTARLVHRFMPGTETFASDRYDLVGESGETVFPIDEVQGTAIVHDRHGTRHQVHCHTSNGRIDAKRNVVIVGYDEARDSYVVSEFEVPKTNYP
jgi:membrane protein implicated in regulation of membrane protease activity